MSRTRFITAALVAGLALSRPAHADPKFLPTTALGVEASYDSNVFNGRGPDYVTRITPRLALHLIDPRYDLKLSYDVGVWIYAMGKANNTVNHQGRATFVGQATRRLTFKIADEVIFAHDPGFLLRAGVVAPQTSIFDNTVDAEVDYLFGRTLLGAIDYSYRFTTFGTPPPGSGPLFDGTQHDAVAALEWHITRLDTLRLENRFTFYTANGLDLAVVDTPALSWRHRFLRVLEASAMAGPLFYGVLEEGRTLSPINALQQSGWTWRGAALIRVVTRDFRLALSFTRDLVGGTGAASVIWADYVTARAVWRIERIVELSIGGSVFANGYAPSSRRQFDGVTADAAASVEVYHGIRVGAFYAFRWQEALANLPDAPDLPGISRHIAGLRITAAWGEEAAPPRLVHHE